MVIHRRVLATVAAAALLWSVPAAAEPTFPGDVDNYLNQPGLVEQLFPGTTPPGCDLCHVNGATGGLPLTRFGASLGITQSPPTDSELLAALKALDGSNPRALDDLRMGKDPNEDAALASNEAPPQYGCRCELGRTAREPVWLAAFSAALGMLVVFRRRRRT